MSKLYPPTSTMKLAVGAGYRVSQVLPTRPRHLHYRRDFLWFHPACGPNFHYLIPYHTWSIVSGYINPINIWMYQVQHPVLSRQQKITDRSTPNVLRSIALVGRHCQTRLFRVLNSWFKISNNPFYVLLFGFQQTGFFLSFFFEGCAVIIALHAKSVDDENHEMMLLFY